MSPGFPVHPQMLPRVAQAFDRKSMKSSTHEVTCICGYNIDLKQHVTKNRKVYF